MQLRCVVCAWQVGNLAANLQYYGDSREQLQFHRDSFDPHLVSWSQIQVILTNRSLDLQERVAKLLETETKGRHLLFFDHLVKHVKEGEGVVTFNSKRLSIVVWRLLHPLFVSAGQFELSSAGRHLGKSVLRELANVVAEVTSPETGEKEPLQALLKRLAQKEQDNIKLRLDARQKTLKSLHAATKEVKVMVLPHACLSLSNGHCPLPWLFPLPYLGHDQPDIVPLYQSLRDIGLCKDPLGFSIWFDEAVLPSINWALTRDPRYEGGACGPKRTSRPILRVVASALLLCAYDHFLVAMARKTDGPFQNYMKKVIEAVETVPKGDVCPGPLKKVGFGWFVRGR